MSSLYRQFNCKSKEELYEKIKNKDEEVKSLLEFMDFAKADIKNKNKAIVLPEILIDYVKSLTMPTKDAGTIIFVDIKNQPVLLKRTRLSRKNDIKDTIKEGLVSGGTQVFMAFNKETSSKKAEEIKTLFFNVGLETADTLIYDKSISALHSIMAKKAYHVNISNDIINDEDGDYTRDDFSSVENYKEFSSYYARNEVIEKNIDSDIDEIKENLKIGFQHHDQEIFGIIAYDKEGKVMLVEELFKGGVSSAVLDHKILAKRLLHIENLKGISIFHNHPSGIPDPSNEDIAVTKRIALLCKAIDVEFLDHYIIGKKKVLSFVDEVKEFKGLNSLCEYKLELNEAKGVNKDVSENKVDYRELGSKFIGKGGIKEGAWGNQLRRQKINKKLNGKDVKKNNKKGVLER